MNHNEIESCVIRAKKGYQEDFVKLLEQFKPFILKTARQYNINNHDINDLLQIGYTALVNAVAKYKIGSHSFIGYALSVIRNAFRHAARSNNKFMSDLSLNSQLRADDSSSDEYIEHIEADLNLEEDIIHSEAISEVRQAVSKLPEEDMEFVVAVYYKGASIKAYAERNGLSYSRAVRKKDRILKMLGLSIKR